jgi:hypothetical protein
MGSENQEKKSLDIRIAEIERKLDELTKTMSSGGELRASKEDIETFNKVLKASLATDWGEFCGINDCMKCIIVVCRGGGGGFCSQCRACIFECSCGPCNCDITGGRGGRLSRRAREFESFG